jgi:tripartite-type tricarboxylate transporter receptor subunit TctC
MSVPRLLSAGGALFLLLGFSVPSAAQPFPTKPLRIVVPFSAGSPDLISRLIAAKVATAVGQPVVVENKAGASGMIGGEYVAKTAPADGYTAMYTSRADYATTPAINPKMSFDPIADFAPVTQATRSRFFLATGSSSGIRSVQDLVALAKARPGQVNYGSTGIGQIPHLGMEQLARTSGTKLVHVPYRQSPEAVSGLMTGELSAMFSTLAPVGPLVKDGKIRLIAVASSNRSSLMADVPTVAESGFPGFEVEAIAGYVVRSGTPRPIVNRLNAEFVQALKFPDVVEKIQAIGLEVIPSTPEQFGERMRTDHENDGRLVREIGIKGE